MQHLIWKSLFIAVFLAGVAAPAAAQQGAGESLPDPRYRPPLGLWEIDAVASMVAKASGYEIRGDIIVSDDSQAPLARVSGSHGSGRIEINPRAAREVPPNSWAFILGHEFAHLTAASAMQAADRSREELETAADLAGAEFALQAGFKIEAHIAWGLSRPDPEGFHHYRMQTLAGHFQVPQHVIAEEIRRHRGLRQ